MPETALERLLADVQTQPWAHDFYALLRRIDSLHPAAPRTGAARRPQQEALRLAQRVELDFAPAPLAALEQRHDAPPRLSVRFFGLLGPQGPLPLHLTEYVRDRRHHHGDSAPSHFLDLFHHRLLSLFYRAWAEAQPVVHRDRPDQDRYAAWLAAAAGLPRPTALPVDALLFQAGLLAGRTRHPEAMAKVLAVHFRVPVQVEPHVGQWLGIDARDRTRLGHARNRTERHRLPLAQLGADANAGARAWDRQYRFRLRLGPLTMATYEAFLPSGSAWAPLAEWVRLLAGPELQWELELDLAAQDRPPPRLGRAVRLGVTTWVGTGAPRRVLQLRPRTSFLLHGLQRGRPAAPIAPAPLDGAT